MLANCLPARRAAREDAVTRVGHRARRRCRVAGRGLLDAHGEPSRRGEGNRGGPANQRGPDQLGWGPHRFGDVLTMRRFSGNQEMENNTMTMYRAPLALLLGTFMTVGCWQQLDQNASERRHPGQHRHRRRYRGEVSDQTTTPRLRDGAATTATRARRAASGCDKDKYDVQQILSRICDGATRSAANGNLKGIDDIMHPDQQAFLSEYMGRSTSSREIPPTPLISSASLPMRCLRPAARGQPMQYPSISDMSVLQQWIMCRGQHNAGRTTEQVGRTGLARVEPGLIDVTACAVCKRQTYEVKTRGVGGDGWSHHRS